MSGAGARLRAAPRIELGDYPVDAAWSGDGKTLAIAGGEGTVWLAPVAQGSVPRALGRHAGGVLAVAWQRAGRLWASSGQDGVVLLWDARSWQSRPILEATQWTERLAFSDDGRLLAVATGRRVSIFNAEGALQQQLDDHAGSIAALAWRPKSPELAAAGNGGVRMHRLAAGQAPLSRDYPWRGACLTASWSPDGRVLAAGMQDGSAHLWNVASGTQAELAGLGAKVSATDWSANGRYLATAAGSGLVVWEFGVKGAEGAQPRELRAHSERLSALRFRPSGTWLVSAARDRRLLLWRVGTADEPVDAHLLADDCTFLRFSPDGAWLAVGDARGGLTLYNFD